MSTTEIRKNGRHVYVLQRAFNPGNIVDLQEVLNNCHSGIETAPTTYLHVYCDILRLSGQDGRLQVPPGLKVLRIIARAIEASVKMIQITGLEHLSIVTGQIPRELSINTIPILIDTGAVGVTLKMKTRTVLPVLDIEPYELRPLVVEDYHGLQAYQAPIELLVLARRLFSKGIQNCLAPPRSSEAFESLAIFQFIVILTRRSDAQVDLYQQASSLVRRLKLPHAARLFVPSRSSQACKNQLDAWIAATDSVNDVLKEENLEKFIKDQLKKTGEDAAAAVSKRLTEMNQKLLFTLVKFSQQDNDFTVSGLKDATVRRLRELLRAREELKKLNAESEAQHQAFKQSLEKWQGDKEKSDAIKIAKSVFSFVFAIGKAIATEGQGIGDIFSSGAELVGSTSKLIDDIKMGRENDQKLRRLNALGSMVCDLSRYDATAEAWNKDRSISQSDPVAAVESITVAVQKGDIPPIDTFDFFSFQTAWDDFELENEMVFEQLGRLQPPISGIDECILSVRRVVSRSKLYIAARKDEQVAQDKYIRSLMFASHLEQRKADLQNQDPVEALRLGSSEFSISNEQTQALLLETVRKHNAAAKSDLTRWIVLAIYDWVLASAYENALRDPPQIVELKTDLEPAQYKDSIAHISLFFANVANFNLIQKPMLFSTEDQSSIFEKGWKELLISENRVRFRIPSDHAVAKNYSKAFVRRAGIFLHGVKPLRRDRTSSERTLALDFEFGPRLGQKNNKGEAFEYYAKPIIRDFEADWEPPQNVAVYAVFCDKGPDVNTPALYSTGLVRFKGDSAQQWDLSAVTKVEVEILAGYLQSS